jgi:hypothetical protein
MEQFFLKNIKIGLDVDEVVADFLNSFSEWTKIDCTNIKHFDFSYSIWPIIKALPPEFWLNVKPKIHPEDLNFLPTCYISKRSFAKEITEQWIEKNGLPCVPVYHVEHNDTKVKACKDSGIDVYVDDSIINFQELNAAGIKTFLMDTRQNRQFDVGDYRLHHIRELIHKI